MKTKRIIVALIATVSLVHMSCSDFLDIKPEGVLLKEEALQTQEDVVKLQNSTYTVLFSGNFLGGRVQLVSEIMTDHILGTGLDGDWAVIWNRTSSIFEGVIGGLYSEPYIAIYRANVVLENLNLIQDNTLRNRIEGSARFVRALAHFETVRLFAQPYGFTPDNSHLGIPIKSQSLPQSAVRASVAEVYLFVITELELAENLLSSSNDSAFDPNGAFPTKWSAKALMARVYFQMNNFSKAYQYANDVIANGPIPFASSNTEYTQRYSQDGSNEALFKAVSKTLNANGETVYVNRGSGFTGMMRSDVSVPYIKLTQNTLINGSSDPLDVRGTLWYGVKDGFNVIKKFNGFDNISVPIITVTELKLIRAESAAEGNTNLTIAQLDIQDIYDRAYGVGARVAPSTANAIIQESRNQRRLEFIFEGHRGQDLKRIGALGRESVIVRGAPWNCPGSVLQFPQSEIALNPGFVANPEGGC